MQRRDRFVAQSLGLPLTKRIRDSRVLLIGAGGIGCELLKNLVCCGFGTSSPAPAPAIAQVSSDSTFESPRKAEIVVVDLDTIDLSNLNRQFLFRKQHIKKPKATVAKETASQFNPAASINAQHASIFDKQYTVDFFESFDLVFNALDNLAARRHVNRMCLAADVPLIESGTTGFNGQVQVIQKGVTECYDCNPKPVQKSFPICTIRSTPSQPIHCIVWAKSYLFPELFGTSEEDSSDVAVTEGDDAEEVAKLREEAQALKKVRNLMGTSEFAEQVFNKVFHDDIERLKSMSDMWQSRKAPESLLFQDLRKDSDLIKKGQELAKQDQGVWSLEDNLAVFCYSLETLSSRAQTDEKVIEFDKDDKDTLDLVASAANIRAHVFGIVLHSEWEIKQMAGNIIPAIATSNALTASLCVLQAFKVIRSQSSRPDSAAKSTTNNHVSTKEGEGPVLGGAKMVFLNSRNTERMILSEGLRPPNKTCPVCSPFYAKLTVPEDGSTSLKELVDLLKERLGYEDFSITTDAGLIYDPDLEDNIAKPLKDLGVDPHSNGFVTVADDSDEPKVDLVLTISTRATGTRADVTDSAGSLQLLPERIALPPKPPKASNANGETDSEAKSPVLAVNASLKRKREADEEVDGMSKKAKADDGVVVVEDDGAIVLED